MCTWLVSTIYSLTPPLPELVPVRHGHPRPPEGPRPRRGAAASQIRRQSTGTRSGDLRSSEAYALPIQGYHMDLSTGACGGAGGPGAQPQFNSGSTPRMETFAGSVRERIRQTENTQPTTKACTRLAGRCGPWCTRERGRRVAPAGDPARLRPARRCAVTAPWQECGDELAEREQQMAKVCQRESLASGRRRSSP